MEYFTLKQAAGKLQVSFPFLLKLIEEQRLASVLVGMEVLVTQDALEK
jgi:excisionase family DNA binding protein